MDFADAFARVKGKLGAESREAKGVALIDTEEQLVSQNLLEGPVAKNLALEHLLERASVARCASRRRYEETTPLVFLNPNSLRTFTIVSASTMLVAAAVKIVPRQDVWLQ